jgi:hypothetical protein
MAVRSTRLLGAFFIAFGVCGMVPFATGGLSPRNASGVLIITGTMFYFVPGLLYVVFSIYLARRQFWAVIGALVLASVQLLFVLISLLGLAALMPGPHAGVEPIMLIPICLILLVAAAIGQLVYHLARSFEAIKYPPYGQEFHGFEPIMGAAQRVVPPAPPAAPPDHRAPE